MKGSGFLRGALPFFCVVLAGLNLRASITSVGPVIGGIREDMGLSSGLAGLLTTLPLLAFAAFSSLAPRLAGRFGLSRTLFGGLVLLAAGIALRSLPQEAALFAGTAVLGAAIAAANVLLPGFVKRYFPRRVGPVTGTYITAMNVGAALGAGLSAPLARSAGLGWQGALGVWAVPVLLAVLAWAPLLKERPERSAPGRAPRGPWRSALAWQVTLFMGLQSVVFFVSITWLPAILGEGGLSAVGAGWMVSLMQLVGIPATLLVPVLAARMRSQSALAAGAALLSGTGILGLLFLGGPLSSVPVVLLGLGQGAAISLALTLFALRAADAAGAAALSGMAQTVGYLFAAAGPPLFGALHDATGGWTVPLVVLCLVTGAMLLAGIGAGRDAVVRVPERRPADVRRPRS
ncbi:major facilitator superfamily MFS_1 [Rubrobacter xylanophilus DSM 9941]|uniref:Major facilitator superfamily MFS_1 n=1 Tax=Rubrobacter xylanophilus (strain DSM 9941 / JCM 11954 / NBRC 16129 / PRD-1) TaxID=266117 RepID=Q1AVQ3_RUBXD|nr:MFS transporter [Rubrobacter xylanophilus]ABG04525.1 major facilitator superfamily MFS_1 [Rubrobacter xylanophilus DSM 9941]